MAYQTTYQTLPATGAVAGIPGVTGGTKITMKRSGSSGGGGGYGNVDLLIREYQKAYDAAKAANEQRYEQILGEIGNLGVQREADIRTEYGNRLTQMQQDLVSRGLTGTTVLPSIQQSNLNDQTSAVNRLKEDLLAQKLGVMERRDDTYPDYGMLMQLAMGSGNYGGGGGIISYGGGGRSTRAPRAPAKTDAQLIADYGSATAAYRATGRSSLANAYMNQNRAKNQQRANQATAAAPSYLRPAATPAAQPAKTYGSGWSYPQGLLPYYWY